MKPSAGNTPFPPVPAWRRSLEPIFNELRSLAETRDRRVALGLRFEVPRLRFVLVGEPGRGQKLAAEAIASELKQLEFAGSGQVATVPMSSFPTVIDNWRNQEGGPPESSSTAAPHRLHHGVWAFDGTTPLTPTTAQQQGTEPPWGQLIRRTAAMAAEDTTFDIPFILLVTQDVARELEATASLRFEYRRKVELPHPTPLELAAETRYLLHRREYAISDSDVKALEEHIDTQHGLTLDLSPVVADELILAHAQRTKGSGTKQVMKRINKADFAAALPMVTSTLTVKEVLAEFDRFVGMDDVRERFEALAALAITRRSNAAAGRPLGNRIDNYVFTGPPGTGKTTVARKLGELFVSLGMLQSGHVVERNRSSLVGRYVGHSEALMREAIKEARHGVLFIDEAYGLADNSGDVDGGGPGSTNSRDFGALALQTLIAALTDPEYQPVVCVVAGYPEQMAAFFKSNPGLASRFSGRIAFDSYPDEVLGEIFARGAEERHLSVTMPARQAAMKVLSAARDAADEKFGNAREALTLVELSIQEASQRAVKDSSDNPLVTSLAETDVLAAGVAMGVNRGPSMGNADPLFGSILERAVEQIDGQETWSDESRTALKHHLARVRRGEQFGFATGLPRTVNDVLVAQSSGVSIKVVSEILNSFYVGLGALSTGRPLVVKRPSNRSDADLVEFVDELFEKSKGKCLVIPSLEDWFAPNSSKPAARASQPMLALADGMRRHRNDVLVVAGVKTQPPPTSAAAKSLLGEFELSLS